MHALKDVVMRARHEGTTVLLSDVHMQPLTALTGSAVMREIGRDNVFATLPESLERARGIVAAR
jgi:SulP family sulfate permease